MRITASGATDGGNIVLFWPENLPDDFDELRKGREGEVIDRMRGEGRLIWFPCDGDGDHTVAIFLGEPVPQFLSEFCRDEETYPRLSVRGEGFFGGLEYVFKRDASLLERYPGMMERVRLPEGDYGARVWRTDLPEGFRDQWLRKHAGAWAVRVWRAHMNLMLLAIACALATLVALCLVPWRVWFCTAGAVVGIVLVGEALTRTRAYKSVEAGREEYGRTYPSFVVELA